MPDDPMKSMILEANALEREIAELPEGYVSRKVIRGRERFYRQWYEDGKVRSKYIRDEDLESVRAAIARRKECQSRLATLRRSIERMDIAESHGGFHSTVIIGGDLIRWASGVGDWGRRDCYAVLSRYLQGDDDRVCVLYGLRRTGKTTMIRQAVLDMDPDDAAHAAYILVDGRTTTSDLERDLRRLDSMGFTRVFVDEATLMRDFVDGAALLPDVFARMGMRIVLSGTDSLGFWLSETTSLYDRAVTIHTTLIPFREHSRLLGTDDIDDYIMYGGTLRRGSLDIENWEWEMDDVTFRDEEHMRSYSDLAIARNIQNTLRNASYGRYMLHLVDLSEADELTGAINRVIEDLGHRFLLSVLDGIYDSPNLQEAKHNLANRGDRSLSGIDEEAVIGRMREMLEISDAGDRSIPLTDAHVHEIGEFLRALDLVSDIRVMNSDPGIPDSREALILQPGMRYCQAEALVRSLSEDPSLRMDWEARERVRGIVLDSVRGRILEEIVLYETAEALGREFTVSRFRFGIRGGEFDMAVHDTRTGRTAVFEVKHSARVSPSQRRHLSDPEKVASVEGRLGPVVGRYVLYRGEGGTTEDDVGYLNVEEYLKGLPDSALRLLGNDGTEPLNNE